MIPKKYLQRIESFLTTKDKEQVIKGYMNERVCAFRVNILKTTAGEVESFLCTSNIPFDKPVFPALSYVIEKKYEFTLKGSTLFYEGKIYLQGLASQIPANILDLKSNMNVLDVTAAPGSKTTQMSALMNNEWRIIACEKHQIRYDKLVYNIKLQGATNIETHKIDALKLMSQINPETFDAILLDAPCSAEGRFKLSDEKSYGFWTLRNIREKAMIQTMLLEACMPLLKKWWVLVYSTCTLAPEENEAVVSNVIAQHPDFKLEKIEIGNLQYAIPWIQSFDGRVYNDAIENTIRILPSHLTEGFYLAKIRKDW